MSQRKTISMSINGPPDPLTGKSSYVTHFFTDGSVKRSKKRSNHHLATDPEPQVLVALSTYMPTQSASVSASINAPPPLGPLADTPDILDVPSALQLGVFSRDRRYHVRRMAVARVDAPTLSDSTQLFLVSTSPHSDPSVVSSCKWAAVEIFVVVLNCGSQAVACRCSRCPDLSFGHSAFTSFGHTFRYTQEEVQREWCEHGAQAAAVIHHGLLVANLGINMGTCNAILANCTKHVPLSPFTISRLPDNVPFAGGAYLTYDQTIPFRFTQNRVTCIGCSRQNCAHQPTLREAQDIATTLFASNQGGTQEDGQLMLSRELDLDGDGYFDDAYCHVPFNGDYNNGGQGGGFAGLEMVANSEMMDPSQKDPTQYHHEVLSVKRYSLSQTGRHQLCQIAIARDAAYLCTHPRDFAPEGIDRNRPPCCSTCGSATMVQVNYSKGWVLTRFHLFKGIGISHIRCTKKDCDFSISYDGRQDGLVNHSNYLLLDAQLLLQAAHMWKSGTAIKLWWESHLIGYRGHFSMVEWSNLEKTLKGMRGRITKTIVGFLTICDFPELEWCTCVQVNRICVDGLVASCATKRMPKFERPYFAKDKVFPKKYDRATRSLWSMNGVYLSRAVRSLLIKKLAKGEPVENDKLRVYVDHPGIRLLWYFFQSGDDGAMFFLPKQLDAAIDLALALGKDVSPAIQILPKRAWPAIDACLTDSMTGAHHTDLLDHAPLIARLLDLVQYRDHTAVDPRDVEWWDSRVNQQTAVFKYFVQSAIEIAKESVGSPITEDIEDLAVDLTPIDELLTYGDFFPRHPIIRRIPTVKPEKKEKDVDVCTKNTKGTTRLAPGVFLWWCLDCSLNVGFTVLDSAESAHHAFATLRTRFDKPPSIVVYDNACNLSEYCLNRDPFFFSDTLFLVDALHFSNHVNCSPVYYVKQYRSMVGVSSVMHEQKNSLLHHLKDLAPLMAFQTFAYLLCFAVALV